MGLSANLCILKTTLEIYTSNTISKRTATQFPRQPEEYCTTACVGTNPKATSGALIADCLDHTTVLILARVAQKSRKNNPGGSSKIDQRRSLQTVNKTYSGKELVNARFA